MDQEDPEKRIADLERQLAEHKRIAEPTSPLDRGVDLSHHGALGDVVAMPIRGESAAPRHFVASAPRLRKRVGLPLLAASSVSGLFVLLVLPLVFPHLGGQAVHGIAALTWCAAIGAIVKVGQMSRDVSIYLTGDSLIVNEGSGGVFPLINAKLGQWAGQGTALHLRNADHRFVLGGRQYAVPTGARLDAKRVYSVDAWIPASAFHALLNDVCR
jgi:hypothetical protein